MAVKRVEVTDLGTLNLYKRRGAKTMRLSLNSAGEIRVSMPFWLPYSAAIEFAMSKKDWVLSKRTIPQPLKNNERIGKAHRLAFVPTANIKQASARIVQHGEIRVTHPLGLDPANQEVQKVAKAAAIRALKQQANLLLPKRTDQLAAKHGFNYSKLEIKQLKSRWGSCSSRQEIALNCYLMQLPWHLIDYVILHELVHTKIMAHGKVFWDELARYVPNLKQIRQEIKAYQPILISF